MSDISPQPPDPSSAELDKVRVLIELERFAEAASRASDLINSPFAATAFFLIAKAEYLSGNFQVALDAVLQSLAISHDPQAFVLLASIQSRLNQSREAIININNALKINPENPEAWAIKGEILMLSGNYPGARLALEKALRLKPDYTEAENCLLNVRILLGHLNQASRLSRKLLALNPSAASPHLSAGTVALFENNPARARQHFLAALAQSPDSQAAREALSISCLLDRTLLSRFPDEKYASSNLVSYAFSLSLFTAIPVWRYISPVSIVFNAILASSIIFLPRLILAFSYGQAICIHRQSRFLMPGFRLPLSLSLLAFLSGLALFLATGLALPSAPAAALLIVASQIITLALPFGEPPSRRSKFIAFSSFFLLSSSALFLLA